MEAEAISFDTITRGDSRADLSKPGVETHSSFRQHPPL